MKKQPSLEFSSPPLPDTSGSLPTNGEATRVPMRRRVSLLVLGSGIAVTSVLVADGDWVLLDESAETCRRAQWTTLKG